MRVNCAVAPYVWRYRCAACGLNFLGGVEVVQLYADHTWTHIDLETLTSVTSPASGTHDPIALTAPSDSQAAMGPREGQPSGSAPAAPPPGGAAT